MTGLGVGLRVRIGAVCGVRWKVRCAYIVCCVIWGHGGEEMVCSYVGGPGVLQSIWGVRSIMQEDWFVIWVCKDLGDAGGNDESPGTRGQATCKKVPGVWRR